MQREPVNYRFLTQVCIQNVQFKLGMARRRLFFNDANRDHVSQIEMNAGHNEA